MQNLSVNIFQKIMVYENSRFIGHQSFNHSKAYARRIKTFNTKLFWSVKAATCVNIFQQFRLPASIYVAETISIRRFYSFRIRNRCPFESTYITRRRTLLAQSNTINIKQILSRTIFIQNDMFLSAISTAICYTGSWTLSAV